MRAANGRTSLPVMSPFHQQTRVAIGGPHGGMASAMTQWEHVASPLFTVTGTVPPKSMTKVQMTYSDGLLLQVFHLFAKILLIVSDEVHYS